jgi:hypothetical protein
VFLKDVSEENVEGFTKIVKALVIVSRNLDNIPFIASCQLIPSCISVSSNILTCMMSRQLEKNGVVSIVLVCLFLEALYDPYFSYRKSIVKEIKYHPALLQAEVIPFIYGNLIICVSNEYTNMSNSFLDCFQHLNATSIPVIALSLLHLFGGIIKGGEVIRKF